MSFLAFLPFPVAFRIGMFTEAESELVIGTLTLNRFAPTENEHCLFKSLRLNMEVSSL